MQVSKVAMRRPITSAWVTTADIGGTGQAVVASADMVITVPTVGLILPVLEVQFTHIVTGGGGTTFAWVKILGYQQTVAADNSDAADYYTPRLQQAGGGGTRIIRIPLTPLQARSVTSAYQETLFVSVRGAGRDVATVWTTTGIKSRLIYVPI